MLEIEKTLVASTSHLKKSEIGELSLMFSSHESDYGITIYIGDEIEEISSRSDISEELNLIALFAISSGCTYIKFDCDGPIYDFFKRFSW
tara:strand:- start:1218 stop:1487 length:270 start_codon:yes stop_codon:yes gene_type:complete